MNTIVLIVDDNDKYANNLAKFFQEKNIPTERAYTAKQGWEMHQSKSYHTIITDITMETQTSGLWLARRLFRSGFSGNIIIATTGFDVWGVMFISRFLLPIFAGVKWMIPKVPLKQGIVEFHPTTLSSGHPFQ